MPEAAEVQGKVEAAAAAETEQQSEKAELKAAEKAVEKAEDEKEIVDLADLGITGLVETEEGFEYTLGNSVYKGATLKDVFANAQKGVEDKDKASKELDSSLRELKAKRAIRTPDRDEDDDVIEAPQEADIIKSVFEGTDLIPAMMYWSDDQWEQYRQSKELTEFKMTRMYDRVQQLKQKATERLNAATQTWLNRTTLHERITPAVQRLVAKSGLDPEEHNLGDKYLELLKDKRFIGNDGLLRGEDVVEAMSDYILERVKPAKESAVRKAAEAEAAKLAQKKKDLGSGSTAAQKTEVKQKPPLNIDEASKRMLELLR